MKKLFFASLFVALFSCSDDSVKENFTGEHINKVSFKVDGKSVSLNFGSADHNARIYVSNDNSDLDSVRTVAGINLFRESNGDINFSHELDIRVKKTFLVSDPEVEIPSSPDNKYSSTLLNSMFVDHGPLISIWPLSHLPSLGKDGIYIMYNAPSQVEGGYEEFVVVPSVEVDSQLRYSSFTVTQAIANPEIPLRYPGDLLLKTIGTFDLYMRNETSGEIIHLENGEFVFYFAPYL